MENNFEYIKLFMEYETNATPVVFLYEVDLSNDRLMLREIEIFVDRHTKLDANPYRDVIEIVPIPTVAELNAKIWGDGFFATNISKEDFEKVWETGVYNDALTAI